MLATILSKFDSQLRDPDGTATRLRSRASEPGQRHGVPAAEEFKRLRIS